MITLSKLAAEKITGLLREQEAEGAALRVFVRSDGGAPAQIGMAIDSDRADTDETVESEGITVVVDAESLPFVIGSEIDYVDSMLQSGFTIRNPNMAGGCGGGGACGCGGGGGGGACGCGGGGGH